MWRRAGHIYRPASGFTDDRDKDTDWNLMQTGAIYMSRWIYDK